MRALTCTAFDEPETLTVTEQPTPGPGPGEVLIRVQAASVNYPDALMVQGKYQVRPPLPFTPGAEAAGTVEAVGEGVTHLTVGQRVAAFTGTGAFATHLIAPPPPRCPPGRPRPERRRDPAPGLRDRHARPDRPRAAESRGDPAGPGRCRGRGPRCRHDRQGPRRARDRGRQHPEKLDLARAHGADEVINYEGTDLKAAVAELTGKKGVDVILDPVGDRWAECLPRHRLGRALPRDRLRGRRDPRLPLNLPLLKGASIVGVFWGEYARRDPRGNARHLTQLASWVQSGTLKPEISRTYTLQEAPQAMRDLLERRVTGKVIVTP